MAVAAKLASPVKKRKKPPSSVGHETNRNSDRVT
jgi:hypothetical protein